MRPPTVPLQPCWAGPVVFTFRHQRQHLGTEGSGIPETSTTRPGTGPLLGAIIARRRGVIQPTGAIPRPARRRLFSGGP